MRYFGYALKYDNAFRHCKRMNEVNSLGKSIVRTNGASFWIATILLRKTNEVKFL
ncbi:hypothetical protein [Helicobacter sp. MIT 01-3238]|uniref:hypothetical protein n=1 Tax=Helicobacter sp. MIT 01-3238 TaxID=398627 RepID=UPI0015F1952B|nr:hypothetical protein [Helicobacter sp. MIT 01-3238]